MITGFATLQGTKNFLLKHQIPLRKSPVFHTSPIAVGTHLGEMTENDSVLYREGIEHAIINGLNFIDTAINYRGMRSERDVGYVLKKLIKNHDVLREEIVVSTKAGIIPGDVEARLVPKDYLKQILLQRGILEESDLHIYEHQRHVLSPNYFRFAIGESRKHLNLETIDVFYIHNPEISKMVLEEEIFYEKLKKLFSFMEEEVRRGTIRFYGFATWFGFLKDTSELGYLSLEKVVNIARHIAGEEHHFKFIQFPLNREIKSGVVKKNQRVKGKWLSLREAAKEFDILPTTSAPFNLGKLLTEEDPSNLLLDVLQTEGILSTMVGMKNIHHIRQNINLLK